MVINIVIILTSCTTSILSQKRRDEEKTHVGFRHSTDVIVASIPKSDTTWLKALTFFVVNRQHFYPLENHPLLTSNPHELGPFLEFIFQDDYVQDKHSYLSNMTQPRTFGTHIPFSSLCKSIKESNCKIIYICRNPFDTFVSAWIFSLKHKPESLHEVTIEEALEKYCKGIIAFGPTWDHMLGYWKESIVAPNKVLFLKYEELKENSNFYVKRVTEFLDSPFVEEEESNGVIENIVKLCSFENMKNLEVNKSGTFDRNFEKKILISDCDFSCYIKKHPWVVQTKTFSKNIHQTFSQNILIWTSILMI